jgi:antitoxin VapB
LVAGGRYELYSIYTFKIQAVAASVTTIMRHLMLGEGGLADCGGQSLSTTGKWHMLQHMSKYANREAMTPERHVKLFKNGRNQAVRIPREFELPGDDAIMRKDGNKLIIEAVPPRSLLALLQTLQPIGEEFPEVSDEPPDEVNI